MNVSRIMSHSLATLSKYSLLSIIDTILYFGEGYFRNMWKRFIIV